MSAIERYRRILSVLLPAGALGMSILLGSTGAEAAREAPTGAQPPDGAPGRIAERLSAVRDAVSEITGIEDKAAAPLEGTDKKGINFSLWLRNITHRGGAGHLGAISQAMNSRSNARWENRASAYA